MRNFENCPDDQTNTILQNIFAITEESRIQSLVNKGREGKTGINRHLNNISVHKSQGSEYKQSAQELADAKFANELQQANANKESEIQALKAKLEATDTAKKLAVSDALLVSLLEADSELYNTGIVDVSHKYEKMYVVRPQFFLPIISLLRNAAMNALEYKSELALVKAQNVDVTRFEENLDSFKNAFGKNYELASRRFEEAIKEIDKSIDHLEKTKKALQGTDRNLQLANNKAQDVTIKKLIRNNPTMKAKFEGLKD